MAITQEDIKRFLNNGYFVIILITLVMIYIYMVMKDKPKTYILNLFKNDLFRVVFLALLLIYSYDSFPHIALIITIIFAVSMYVITVEEEHENIEVLKAVHREQRYGLNNF